MKTKTFRNGEQTESRKFCIEYQTTISGIFHGYILDVHNNPISRLGSIKVYDSFSLEAKND